MKTIDITPKWSGLMPVLIDMLMSDSVSEATKKEIGEHLVELAKEVDDINGSYLIRPLEELTQ